MAIDGGGVGKLGEGGEAGTVVCIVGVKEAVGGGEGAVVGRGAQRRRHRDTVGENGEDEPRILPAEASYFSFVMGQ